MKTVVGMFDNFAQARNAAHDLEKAGISHEDISIMSGSPNAQPQTVREATGTTQTPDDTYDTPAAETGKGAVTGGVLGLIAGLVMLAIPGVGTVFGAGWLWLILGGAVAGGVVGLVGALVHAGVPHEQALVYNEAVRRGGTLIAVRAADDMADRVAQILSNDGAVNIDERAAQYRQEGWTPDQTTGANTYTAPAGMTTGTTTSTAATTSTAPTGQGFTSTTANQPVQTTTGANAGTATYGEHVSRNADYDNYDQDFRNNWQSMYANQGSTYEQYEPAYRYGYDLAGDQRYRSRDWNTIEPEIQRDWETRQPGTWVLYRSSIRYAWDKATGAERGGIKTGGYHTDDGTPDQRGIMEKVADTVTGDRVDDKTGKPV
jgi:hypothetical protein